MCIFTNVYLPLNNHYLMSHLKKLNFIKIISNKASKWQIKIVLAALSLMFVVAVILISVFLVNQLIEKEKRIIETYSHLHQKLLRTESGNVDEIILLIDSITPNITFPIIMTDANDSANYPYENYTLNMEINKSMSREEQSQFMQSTISEMGKNYPPVVVRQADGKVLMKFFYTNSKLIASLKYFPAVASFMVAGIILIGYLAFSNIRRNEEQKVWVGMAKEAAHQLGTPLSSLSAWVEILRFNIDDPKSISETVTEMSKDISRLNTIANRFSKIGSEPELTKENVVNIVERACIYFDKRLPHLGRKVEINREYSSNKQFAMINVDLFTWVIENLIRNAAEAIEVKNGEINISMQDVGNEIIILVRDNGKGMNTKTKKEVFIPGFTTKKRGWGLGLSLCKRIVEQYHNGKIFVKESAVGKGTTFAIEIPKKINHYQED